MKRTFVSLVAIATFALAFGASSLSAQSFEIREARSDVRTLNRCAEHLNDPSVYVDSVRGVARTYGWNKIGTTRQGFARIARTCYALTAHRFLKTWRTGATDIPDVYARLFLRAAKKAGTRMTKFGATRSEIALARSSEAQSQQQRLRRAKNPATQERRMRMIRLVIPLLMRGYLFKNTTGIEGREGTPGPRSVPNTLPTTTTSPKPRPF